jgi:glycine reductase
LKKVQWNLGSYSNKDSLEAKIMKKIKVVHYINQFFAGIGGEEKADIKPEKRDGIVGPGMGLNGFFKDEAEIVGTIICGDSYFNENVEKAQAEIIEMIKSYKPDLFIAGPAFNAGRYGVACGNIAKFVKEELNIPVVTAMYVENPGADMYRSDVYMIETGNSAVSMRKALPLMASFALKLSKGEEIGTPLEEGYLPTGKRRNIFVEEIGGKRAVDMLVKKLNDEEFETEYPMPIFDNVAPGKAIKDLSKAKIALVTSGGIVPCGNPDRVESSSASKYGRYDISGINTLVGYETAHGGYDPSFANNDANRVVPLDVLREMEEAGNIGELYGAFYSTVGNGTAVKSSLKFAEELTETLIRDEVDAVILTST